MASERSNAIWERSTSLSEFVAKQLISEFDKQPLVATRLRWQLPELIFRLTARLYQAQDSEQIRRLVLSSRVIATGFRRAHTKSRLPVIIPAEAFANGRIGVLLSTLEFDGGSYQDVRVIRSKELPRNLVSERPRQTERNLLLRNEIRRLQKAGAFHGRLKKEQIAIVSAALQKADIRYSGTDANLGRIIARSIDNSNN